MKTHLTHARRSRWPGPRTRLCPPAQPARGSGFAAGVVGLSLLASLGASAATLLPLEFRQTLTPYNLEAQRGVPISSVTNNPPGSDGRVPSGQNESGTYNLVTTNQFKGVITFGAVAARTNWLAVSNAPTLNGATAFSTAVAADLQLPRIVANGVAVMVLRQAQVGAPYLARQINFSFGSPIDVPDTDEYGKLLTNGNSQSYWMPEPYSTNHHLNTGYYWSPNAKQVFVIQAGPLIITWRKQAPYTATTLPTNYVNQYGTRNFETNGSSIYVLYTVNYLGSGSAAKPPKTMYWTEKSFRNYGRPISVPVGRVGAVNIVYNNNFPRNVTEEYRGPGYTSPVEGSTNQTLAELRTLWYDQALGNIYAYNQEGRVFVELLGDTQGDGQTREHLGYEIVDVIKQPVPTDLRVDLGERVLPSEPYSGDDLFPEQLGGIGTSFLHTHNVVGSDRVQLYALRETVNQNDCLVHWLEESVAGLRWPCQFARYTLRWPSDVAHYSHYLRPAVATENEARQTAVALSTTNVPVIAYQDPLDQPRAKLTEALTFYTFLDSAHPVHRTLLRFTSGAEVSFVRVYSWLDTNLRTTNFAETVATELDAWNTNGTFQWPSLLTAPAVIEQTVNVGDRIVAPAGELGSGPGEAYLAGHINLSAGDLYHPQAYADPLAVGFAQANQGAIIPVNAMPSNHVLEVWWFRTNGPSGGLNSGNSLKGFQPIYWPSVLGRYTLQWPANPREIVLASQLGSGPLNAFEAAGGIYRQNNRAEAGFNPNEEHALLAGGVAYATRDDLNLTNASDYSSPPFVLVSYVAQDGRPAVSAFKVLREKPAAGYVFDYVVTAGRMLQPPMPLPLLGKPVEGSGDQAINYNTEPVVAGGDLPGGWQSSFTDDPAYQPYTNYVRFTWLDRHHDRWVYRGLHAGLPVLEAGTYRATNQTFRALTNATAIVGSAFRCTLHASRQDQYLTVSTLETKPEWLSLQGLTLTGTPATNDLGTNTLTLVVEDLSDHSRATNTLTLAVKVSGTTVAQAPLALSSTNGDTVVVFSNRPPFLGLSPTPSNSFTMRYYYRTEPSFDWPGAGSPPAAGSIVPYLRPLDSSGDGTSTLTESLAIVYRPVWPERDPSDAAQPLPTLPFGATLAKPKFGLPGVRDMLTAEVLYQQSLGTNLPGLNASVVLHDATREKQADLGAAELAKIPGGVRTDYYQGHYYFPNLVPHLATRLYFDPTRGTNGSLVLKGEFVEETLGESYLMLNVLRGSDLAAALNLCPDTDPDWSKWTNLVGSLASGMETFAEDPEQPGVYLPDPELTVSVAVGSLAEVTSANQAVDSYALSATGPGSGFVTLVESSGSAFTQPGDPVAMHIFRVEGTQMDQGEVKVLTSGNPLSELVTFQHTADLAGRFDEYEYEWKIAAPVDGLPPGTNAYLSLATGTDMPRRTLGGAGIQALGDNYVIMRYRPTNSAHPLCNQWSAWTAPKLAEGWIKRVLAGINPFNQRMSDLFNNRVNTDISMLTQAGKRWEGDVALNLDTLDNYGLIEIYETILRRGRMLSIESGYNYGPANDALLLAAGYLSDLYLLVGGEAWADAANPTIGIGTKDNTYGDIATSLFAFKGQVPSLLEEELALLRGRDDFLMPGVQVAPIYNRLVWNYTRGIDAGEVIYALNYNIQENPNADPDGVINAEDAARLFPQGHGDAYGHYLTALKGYYSLLLNGCFDWVPRAETVNVLGQPVSVDYLDERKFAAAAVATARAGRQVFDLTFRRDYQPVAQVGWEHFETSRTNGQRSYAAATTTNQVVRCWGLDHWASRTGQGSYLNWVVGNALLPETDPNPQHEGIQKIDRTTVPELSELGRLVSGIQTAMDNAEGGLNPLGLPEGGLAFDLNPNVVVGPDNGTHFEQIYQRAKTALNNAVLSFDDAKDVTRLMRSEQDSLADFQTAVSKQELAYRNALIELYGTPYSDDIGAGKTWKQGYPGPDLIHFAYVNIPESSFGGAVVLNPTVTNRIDSQQLPSDWVQKVCEWNDATYKNMDWVNSSNGFEFIWGAHGFFEKPATWTGRRQSPGKIQAAISELIKAHDRVTAALAGAQAAKKDVDDAIQVFKASRATHAAIDAINLGIGVTENALTWAQAINEMCQKAEDSAELTITRSATATADALPTSFIAGVATGGDLTSAAKAAILGAGYTIASALDSAVLARFSIFKTLEASIATARRWMDFDVASKQDDQATREALVGLGAKVGALGDQFNLINQRLREDDDALARYHALLAEGDRIQEERLAFRQRAAAVVQGYRTRDAAFRLFRNEKLERYKTLFDLAARYAFLAANAYDYETGLLGTSAGRDFAQRLVNARALGVVRNGEPQYAGSDTGDPGLSSALAEMKADWDVLRGRLGFNRPDAYGTTVSLRTECLRILPSSDGDSTWKDLLQGAVQPNVLEDPDVRRYCMQIDPGDGLPVPGLVLSFSTTIANGYNLFGQQLAAGDHAFSSSSFATKIFGVGTALIGYRGMDDPAANSGAVGGAGGTSPSDPSLWYLDPLALSATPYVYLIPVGVDSMRSPPLGDASTIRSWSVQDVAIPMPFNLGASDFSSKPLWQSSDSLTETLFTERKHQAFRPVSVTSVFSPSLYTSSGSLQRSQYTNNRLVGRSVWNSQWKLVIPGNTLLNDPKEGLSRFMQTVTDIKLHFVTYSYSGN